MKVIIWRMLFFSLCLSLAAVAAAGGKVWIDDLGREVVLPHTPRRIVSLAPSLTEMLFALGVGDRVVGVTLYDDYPPEARQKPKIGGMNNPNLEKILSLQPDLVLATAAGNTQASVLRLASLGIPVYTLWPRTIGDILQELRKLGEVLNVPLQAEELVRSLQDRLDRVRTAVADFSPPRVLYVVWHNPLITVGKGSYIHDMIRLAGGENIAADAPLDYPTYSLEEVLVKKPEIIVVAAHAGKEGVALRETWQRWRVIPAIAENRIFTVNADLFNRPGPRVVDGVEQLARIFHPQAFSGSLQR
ncbi:MAG: cobalamin-binding protein [Nitrospinota bacterium]|nr:MAG: cobalamin-binding protein [Nitrospinota bacterium]